MPSFPDFYARVEPIVMQDALARALGAAGDGILTYQYEDAVKLAGHSCPTVAGAWLLARRALVALYPDGLPQRGGIRVELREAQTTGTTGVVGNVIGLITGAAGEGGFKGLAGRFGRDNLLRFGVPMQGEVRFTRLDSGRAVEVSYDPARVPPDPAMPPLMQKMLAGQATPEETARFGELWQDRVRRLLIDNVDNPELVSLR